MQCEGREDGVGGGAGGGVCVDTPPVPEVTDAIDQRHLDVVRRDELTDPGR